MNVPGLITIASRYSAKETMERLIETVGAKSLTVFARIDHAAAAAEVGLTLRPTELLVFGNARGGTPLMQNEQTIGIDLPLKFLVWEDAGSRTWVSYNDPNWIVERHGNASKAHATVVVMSELVAALARKATGTL